MTMPGFTAERSLYERSVRDAKSQYRVVSQGEWGDARSVRPASLFRYCEGWPPVCCTCDLTYGGCECSNTHTLF